MPTAKDWCARDRAALVDVESVCRRCRRCRRCRLAGRERVLAAIVLTSQVVPALLAPELLLLAVEDVACRWRRYLDRWDVADRPGGAPMGLAEFVDRYCMRVEHGAGSGGCAGRCPPGRAGRGCDPEVCAAGAWWAHVTALARRAGRGHPAHALLVGGVGRGEAR